MCEEPGNMENMREVQLKLLGALRFALIHLVGHSMLLWTLSKHWLLATVRGPAFWAGHSSSCFEPGFPHLRLSPFFLRKPLELNDSHVPISVVDTHALEEAPFCGYKSLLLLISIIGRNGAFNWWANRWDMLYQTKCPIAIFYHS